MTTEAYQRIKATQKLPSPTGVVLEILRLTEDKETTVETLAAVVEKDPALSSQLLKVVNSPLAGMPRQIASVSRATALLGFRTVAGVALGVSLVSRNRSGACAGFDYDAFWSESLGRAVAARHFARHLKAFAHDEAFTCALLSRIGRLAFATVYPGGYTDALAVLGDDADGLNEIECELFGIDHNTLTVEMMGDWHLPEIFRTAVMAQEAPDAGNLEPESRVHRFARLLQLSGGIAEILVASTIDREILATVTTQASRLETKPDIFQQVFDSIREEWRDAGRIFSIPTRNVPTLAEIYTRCAWQRAGLLKAEDRTVRVLDPRR